LGGGGPERGKENLSAIPGPEVRFNAWRGEKGMRNGSILYAKKGGRGKLGGSRG